MDMGFVVNRLLRIKVSGYRSKSFPYTFVGILRQEYNCN